MLEDKDSAGSTDVEEQRHIDAARRGDLPAFNWLVLQHQTRVYNLCLRMLGDAEESGLPDRLIETQPRRPAPLGGAQDQWPLRAATQRVLPGSATLHGGGGRRLNFEFRISNSE